VRAFDPAHLLGIAAPVRPAMSSATPKPRLTARRYCRRGRAGGCRGAPALTPHVEQIQDVVEAALFAAGHGARCAPIRLPRTAPQAARRQAHAGRRRGSVSEYLQQRDWRVNANATRLFAGG